MMNYQDSQQKIEKRVEDLISKMSLTQKISQLSGMTIEKEMTMIRPNSGSGSIAFMVTEDSPEQFTKRCEEFASQIKKQTPWRIPPLIHSEALCGPMLKEHVIFPAPLGVGASFDTELCQEMSDLIRRQFLSCGVRQALAPVLDLARDFRWGRTGETFGGDPTLVASMGCAWIRGLQGEYLKSGILATAKHFLGYSVPESGLNSANVVADRRDLRENIAKPFEAAIRDAGLKCVMAAYGEMEGVPLCANPVFLTKLLREELGFDGFVVSDYLALQMMQQNLGMAEEPGEIGRQCLEAGLDMELPDAFAYSAELREQVKFGKVSEELIDRSVARILKSKFELGLFDESIEPFKYSEVDHLALNTEGNHLSKCVAEESIVLTKNDGILPLKDNQKIALVGPCADSLRYLHNGYTWAAVLDVLLSTKDGSYQNINELFQQFGGMSKAEESVQHQVDEQLRKEHPNARSLKEALEELGTSIQYAKGSDIDDATDEQMRQATELAKTCDLVVLAVGGKVGWDGECTGGEGIDNITAELPIKQQELFDKLFEVNKNVIVIHTDGKPLICENIYEKARAVIEAWLPGPMGGIALANVLTGKISPGGKLPVDVPRHSGQMPIYYYKRRSGMQGRGYRTCSEKPLLPFGYGLSYTTFQKETPSWTILKGESVPDLEVEITVMNTGMYPGDEVLQLYGWDPIASIVRPNRQLFGFQRVHLEPGEKKTVSFHMSLDAFAFPDLSGIWHLEAGEYYFSIAEHAEDPGLQFNYEFPHTVEIDAKKRCFYAHSSIEQSIKNKK